MKMNSREEIEKCIDEAYRINDVMNQALESMLETKDTARFLGSAFEGAGLPYRVEIDADDNHAIRPRRATDQVRVRLINDAHDSSFPESVFYPRPSQKKEIAVFEAEVVNGDSVSVRVSQHDRERSSSASYDATRKQVPAKDFYLEHVRGVLSAEQKKVANSAPDQAKALTAVINTITKMQDPVAHYRIGSRLF